MVTAYQDIVVTRAGEVEILTINRPEVRNALRLQTCDELEHAVRSTAARCLVITGADPDWHELGRWVTGSLHELFRTGDHREGVTAFLERRAPSYTGR